MTHWISAGSTDNLESPLKRVAILPSGEAELHKIPFLRKKGADEVRAELIRKGLK